MQNRTTPEVITTLQPNEVFVFRSNINGSYKLGFAKQALEFGAKDGKIYGHFGNTFALLVRLEKDEQLMCNIRKLISDFLEYAKQNPHLTFLVTKIGCGLAGYTPDEIAPLFKAAIEVENIHLPAEFWEVLNEKN